MSLEIPIPTTISAEAQTVLAVSAARGAQPNPNAGDDEGWARLGAMAASDDPGFVDALACATTGAVPHDGNVAVDAREIDGAKFFVGVPEGLASDDDRVLLYIHGGSFVFGGGATARRSTELIAGNFGVRTWGMDYRQLPSNPFPAGLDDIMSVYRALLDDHRPESIAVAGQSAGANLAAALLTSRA